MIGHQQKLLKYYISIYDGPTQSPTKSWVVRGDHCVGDWGLPRMDWFCVFCLIKINILVLNVSRWTGSIF